MERRANPQLTPTGEEALTRYEQTRQNREDLTPASIRHFLAWDETCLVAGSDEALSHPAFLLCSFCVPVSGEATSVPARVYLERGIC
jgi:hypothetical protein